MSLPISAGFAFDVYLVYLCSTILAHLYSIIPSLKPEHWLLSYISMFKAFSMMIQVSSWMQSYGVNICLDTPGFIYKASFLKLLSLMILPNLASVSQWSPSQGSFDEWGVLDFPHYCQNSISEGPSWFYQLEVGRSSSLYWHFVWCMTKQNKTFKIFQNPMKEWHNSCKVVLATELHRTLLGILVVRNNDKNFLKCLRV